MGEVLPKKGIEDKTIHELRIIAQAFGVDGIFEKEKHILMQEIKLKQNDMAAPTLPAPTPPKYDARLMSEAPAQMASHKEVVDLLEPYIKKGLVVNLTEERWSMAYGNKQDEGTMRMPLKTILNCANKIMK